MPTKKSEIVDGYLYKYHASGKTLWSKGQLDGDGNPHGYWEWYRVDGTLKRSGHFDKGEQVGKWITYNPKGEAHKVTEI